MKKIWTIVIIFAALLIGYKLWAQYHPAPGVHRAKPVPELKGRKIVVKDSMRKYVHFPKCPKDYFNYVASDPASSCRTFFNPSVSPHRIVSSYICRFKDNHPDQAVCHGANIHRVGLSSYSCKSHSPISSTTCTSGYTKLTGWSNDATSDPAGAYAYGFFCVKDPAPRVCLRPGAELAGVSGVDFCCATYAD